MSIVRKPARSPDDRVAAAAGARTGNPDAPRARRSRGAGARHPASRAQRGPGAGAPGRRWSPRREDENALARRRAAIETRARRARQQTLRQLLDSRVGRCRRRSRRAGATPRRARNGCRAHVPAGPAQPAAPRIASRSRAEAAASGRSNRQPDAALQVTSGDSSRCSSPSTGSAPGCASVPAEACLDATSPDCSPRATAWLRNCSRNSSGSSTTRPGSQAREPRAHHLDRRPGAARQGRRVRSASSRPWPSASAACSARSSSCAATRSSRRSTRTPRDSSPACRSRATATRTRRAARPALLGGIFDGLLRPLTGTDDFQIQPGFAARAPGQVQRRSSTVKVGATLAARQRVRDGRRTTPAVAAGPAVGAVAGWSGSPATASTREDEVLAGARRRQGPAARTDDAARMAGAASRGPCASASARTPR